MKEKVSIWVGNFESKDEFLNYTNTEYTEDGDSISSNFEKDFNLIYYDRDLVEKEWVSQSKNNIKDLLKDFSYIDQLIQQFNYTNCEKKFNTAILIYNMEYNAKERKVKFKSNELEFVGVYQYRISIDDRW
ncbi:immunity 22 family protein [Bacillus wiedmannii]|uniref:immunity 22 family protein n=1 Tax=Bacillus wiedmannii TaxID=1890302 RepID=UPI001CBF0053|nr:immunity 22 family protein [Bacillus wiedmannii]MBZ4224022.1 immunity 22 family protein [Bacillus wiedmannii]